MVPSGALALGSLASCLLALGFLAPPALAQSASSPSRSVLPGSGAAGGNDVTGLPAFLLAVPGGTVEMGLDIDKFIEACSQAAYPFNPKAAARDAKDKLVRAMGLSASMLPRRTATVEGFFLGKWPVKNSEYQVYVDRERAAGRDVRPPYHWWRRGCKDDYEKRLEEIRKAFPKDSDGPVYYWERHGHELPYKVQDEDGKSIADLPVVFVSWRDANVFAAGLGMRLPSEMELTRAMRGDGKHAWPLGDQGEDNYTQDLLKQLKLSTTSEYVLKPVGTVAAATGPYGHVDMFGQVWQLCGDLGYEPIHGRDAFDDAWKKLQKDKVGRLLENQPPWRPAFAIAKCGSFLSYQDPVQLLIDARAPVQTVDVLESLGMRLAKSLKPGYDYLYSLQRVKFSRDPFAKDQDLDLTAQVGAERYTVDDNGFPTNYEAVSFAPVNWLLDEKRIRLADLLEATQEKPMIIGALATTAKFDNGTGPDLYAVLYRQMGIPRELSDAVKKGHREIVKLRKAMEKNGGKAPDKKKDDKPDGWRTIIKRYGLTEDDLADKDAADGNVGFVRIDDVVVSTDRDAFLLSKNGAVVSVLPGTNKKPSADQPFASTLVIEAAGKGEKAKSVAKLRFGVPMLARNPKKVVVFDLHAALDQELPTEEKPWRLPNQE